MSNEQSEEEKLLNRQWRYRRAMAQVSLACLVVTLTWALFGIALNKPINVENFGRLIEIIGDLSVAFASIVIAYMTNATWSDIKKPRS